MTANTQTPPELIEARVNMQKKLNEIARLEIFSFTKRVEEVWLKRFGFHMVGAKHVEDDIRLAMLAGLRPEDFVAMIAEIIEVEK